MTEPAYSARLLGATAGKQWRRLKTQSAFLGKDGALVRQLVRVDDELQADALAMLDRYTDPANITDANGALLGALPDHCYYVDNPRAGKKTYAGRWYLVSNEAGVIKVEDQKPPELGITQTLTKRYTATLLTGNPPAADFSTARFLGAPGINKLAESFTCIFTACDPEKLETMLGELNDNQPFVTPTIMGNVLTGTWLIVHMRGYQEPDGSGSIVLKCCKGGRNFGAIDKLADLIKVWTDGNVAWTGFAHYYRQTAAEIVVLLQELSALTGAAGTAGYRIQHRLSEREEGGPYDLMVEVIFGLALDTGWLQVPGRWGTDYVRVYERQTMAWVNGLKNEGGTPLVAGMDVDVSPPRPTGDGLYSGVVVVRTPKYSGVDNKPGSWANFTLKTWTTYIPQHNGAMMRLLTFERGLIHSSDSGTCADAVDGQDNAEVIPIDGGRHFEGRYQTLKAVGAWSEGTPVSG